MFEAYPRALATDFSGYCREELKKVDSAAKGAVTIRGGSYNDALNLLETLLRVAMPKAAKKPGTWRVKYKLLDAAIQLNVPVLVDFLTTKLSNMMALTPVEEEVEAVLRSFGQGSQAREWLAKRVALALADKRLSRGDMVVYLCKSDGLMNWALMRAIADLRVRKGRFLLD
jgi:hypothetical protein